MKSIKVAMSVLSPPFGLLPSADEALFAAARFGRRCVELRGYRLAEAAALRGRASPARRGAAAALRYGRLRPGHAIEVVLRRADRPDEAYWCEVQAVARGDDPRLAVQVVALPLRPDAKLLQPWDALLVRPKEVVALCETQLAAAEVCDDDWIWFPVPNA
jgi:hypothetical protein